LKVFTNFLGVGSMGLWKSKRRVYLFCFYCIFNAKVSWKYWSKALLSYRLIYFFHFFAVFK
jgi:hypothetical protein